MKTTTTTTDTTATILDVIVAGTPALVKSFAGILVAAVATAATAKILKTGQSQKNYEEVLKEFTAK
jgi:hypothetical protein